MKYLVKVAKALADENRLKVLAFIQKNGKVCVCEVSESLGYSQPLSSKYLKQLKEAGLIESKKEGKWSIFLIKDEPLSKPFLDELQKVELPAIKRCLKK